MIGVVLAILFRIIFIAIGIVLVQKFHFILYFFGAFLIFTGVKMFFQNQEEENDAVSYTHLDVYKRQILPAVSATFS